MIHSLSVPRLARVLAWAAMLALVTACQKPADALAPPAIVYGEDVCDQCNMVISEERFAAATLVDEDGIPAPRRFDDIGDMLAYHADHPELRVRRWWVHDYDSREWLDAAAATYVRTPNLRTPMGHGIAAFAAAAAAKAFAASEAGTVITWAQLAKETGAAATPLGNGTREE